MSGAALLTARAAALARIKTLVLDTLPSAQSKRAYGQALDDFFRWCGNESVEGFTKATVNAYRASLEARKLSSSTIYQRLSALRKLATEAADNGFMPPQQAAAISRVKGAKIGVSRLAPHDLRRTFAKLAHKGRAPLEQIQLSLGHASVTTTERYLGVRQDLADVPCDHLGLTIGVSR